MDTSTIKGLVFDLDGTLLDTLEGHASSFNRALQKLQMPTHEIDAYRYFIGNGARVCAERSLPDDAVELADQCVALFKEDYAETWQETTDPYLGITDLLNAQSDKPCAVLSNKDDVFTQKMILRSFPNISFACVAGYGYQGIVKHKPDSSGPQLIATKLGVDVTSLAMIGDTATDMETARESGMTPIGVSWGFRDREELILSGAKHVVDTPQALAELLAGLTTLQTVIESSDNN